MIDREEAVRQIQERLYALQDEGYRAFQCKLMPTVDVSSVIGVRTPLLRALAHELKGSPQAELFLRQLPHQYYEENNLHGFLLERINGFAATLEAVEEFLPYVDNWATSDLLSPGEFKKQPRLLLPHIQGWLSSGQVYTVRFGIEMLMSHFLDENFQPEYLAWVAAVKSQEYYVNMMIAWYFATALAKQYEAAWPYLEKKLLDRWTHNKTIQKAIESYRVSDGHKAELRQLRLK